MSRIAYALVLLVALCAGTRLLAAQPPIYTDVRDFGAVGDGKADDTDALRQAIDAAVTGPNRTYHVYLPPGKYRITSTIELDRQHKDLKIEGAGRMELGRIDPTTMLIWDGEEGGTMLFLPSTMGLRLSDFAMDGMNKAGAIIRVNYKPGFPSAMFYLERVLLRKAHTGFLCESRFLASDMTFVDVMFYRLTYAFHTKEGQNVNYVFIRPDISYSDVGLYFENGGSMTCNLLMGVVVGTAVKIDNGMKNTGNYSFNGFKIEPHMYKGKRGIMFDINGEQAVVYVNGLNTSCIDIDKDTTTPMFKLSGSSQLTLDSSLIWTHHIADIRSTPDGPPSFIRFNNCRFGWSDPRQGGITHDANSGFSVNDCILENGFIPEYRVNPASIMLDPVIGLTALPASATTINLAWKSVKGVDGYIIETSADGVQEWTEVTRVNAKTKKYTVTGLTADTTYHYRVRATKAHVQSGSLPVSATTPKP